MIMKRELVLQNVHKAHLKKHNDYYSATHCSTYWMYVFMEYYIVLLIILYFQYTNGSIH